VILFYFFTVNHHQVNMPFMEGIKRISSNPVPASTKEAPKKEQQNISTGIAGVSDSFETANANSLFPDYGYSQISFRHIKAVGDQSEELRTESPELRNDPQEIAAPQLSSQKADRPKFS
jgi:hypothetical protein